MTEKSIYNDNEKIDKYCIDTSINKYIQTDYESIPQNNIENYITLIISDILKYHKIPPKTSKKSKWKSLFCCCK